MSTLIESREKNEEYHQRPELSSTQMAMFIDDPVAFHFIHQVGTWPKPEPTEAMKFGTSVHEMIELGGPDKMPIVVIPREVLNKDGHRRGKAWTNFKEDNPDALFFKEGERIPWFEIWNNLNANENCKRWIECERKEEEFYWQDKVSGLHCRAKLDVVSDLPIVDWKTSRHVDPRGFQAACYQMHYPERLCFYRRGFEAKYGTRPPAVAVAIENKGSYRVQPFEISEQWLEQADETLSRVLDSIAALDIESELNKPIIEVSAPKWAKFDSEYILGESSE